MDFTPHSEKQERAIFSTAPIVVCGTGIQWGKTRVGAIKTKIAMHTYTDPGDNFIITAPTYKIMQQSTLPAFLSLMEGYGEYSKADAVFKVHGGGTGYFRTATDPDSIVGVTDVRFIWGDEAGKYSLYFWENIQARAGFREAQVVLTTSPYTLNWIFKEIIRPKIKDPDARPDCDLIQAASWENPFFPKSTIDRARQTMDARRFNMIFGGQWNKVEGLVYDCFDETENICDQPDWPGGTRFFAGIDWGYTDPFVMLVMAILPSGKRYIVSEVYKTGLTISDIIRLCKEKKQVWRIERFYCDPSQPGYIEELNSHANQLGANPAYNDIRPGVDYVYELLKTRTLKFVTGACPHVVDEIETYHYPEPDDLKPDQDSREQNPVGQNDHAMDALRYLCVMTKTRIGEKLTPKVAGEAKKEDQFKRIERLKRQRTSYGPSTEEW